jgi:hypothetical protein
VRASVYVLLYVRMYTCMCVSIDSVRYARLQFLQVRGRLS